MTTRRSSQDDSRIKTKHRADNRGILGGFSAPSPHHLRRFSAGSLLIGSGKGVEMVRKSCGKRIEYLPRVYK